MFDVPKLNVVTYIGIYSLNSELITPNPCVERIKVFMNINE